MAATPALPLAGIRVIDMSRVLAGPFCGFLLAQLGAEVIKIEDPKGDETRVWGPFTKDLSDSFLALNMNKKGMVVNLKTPEGVRIIKDLVKDADVLVENFKTGTMERFGLGYDLLKAINPRLVFTSIAAFGRRGYRADYPGYETLVQAYSGIMSFTGMADGEPVRTGVSFLDLSSGLTATLATVTALLRRHSTQEGGLIEGSLFQSAVGLMLVQLSPFFQNGLLPKKLGSGHASATPYQAFQTADGWVLIAAANQNLWEKLAREIGVAWMIADERFKDNPSRMANLPEFLQHLNAVIGKLETGPLVARLVEAGVPSSKINNVQEMVEDGQIDALDIIHETEDPEYGTLRTSGLPFLLSGMAKRPSVRAPKLGEHTREVLGALGYDAARIDALYEKAAVH